MRDFDDIRRDLAAGTATVESITRDYLASIGRQSGLNAFLAVFSESAVEAAREVDRKRSNGTAGSLAGMVVSVKDVLAMKGERLTCGSKILDGFIAPYDATVIARLRAADAVLIGKCNMDEFAMGSSTEHSAFGRVHLPEDEARVPGGSSGGSAVAVSAGMSTASLGSDTGGSIRQPAAFTGVVGLKPTYGRVSRYGLVAFASSFDTIGPFASRVRDAAHVLQTIAGYDPYDATSSAVPVPEYASALTGEVKGLKIGIPREYFGPGLNDEIRSAVDAALRTLREHGAAVTEVSLPHTEYTIAAYYVLATAEASSNLARFDGTRYGFRAPEAAELNGLYVRSRTEGFGPEVQRRIMLGTYVLSAGYYDAYYRKAQKVRRLIAQDFDRVFAAVDCLLTPTTPTTAFRAGEKTDNPLAMYLSDIYTTSANLAGIPGISVPVGRDRRGLPIGVQILGKKFDESTILRVADVLESAHAQ